MTNEKRVLQTISGKELEEESLPYRLYQKAVKHGTWNPEDINFTQDKRDWTTLDPYMKEKSFRLLLNFLGGEEAVTLDLIPLLAAVAKDNCIEETMYMTTFLADEAKHIDFFDRFFKQVVTPKNNFPIHISEDYKKMFYEELPNAMHRLTYDQSPEALAVAAMTYQIMGEGVIGLFGFKTFQDLFGLSHLMPGLLQGIEWIKRDESRHIGYGTFLIQRLISEHDHIFKIVAKRIEELLPCCINILGSRYENLVKREADIRLQILQRARGKTIREIYNSQDLR